MTSAFNLCVRILGVIVIGIGAVAISMPTLRPLQAQDDAGSRLIWSEPQFQFETQVEQDTFLQYDTGQPQNMPVDTQLQPTFVQPDAEPRVGDVQFRPDMVGPSAEQTWGPVIQASTIGAPAVEPDLHMQRRQDGSMDVKAIMKELHAGQWRGVWRHATVEEIAGLEGPPIAGCNQAAFFETSRNSPHEDRTTDNQQLTAYPEGPMMVLRQVRELSSGQWRLVANFIPAPQYNQQIFPESGGAYDLLHVFDGAINESGDAVAVWELTPQGSQERQIHGAFYDRAQGQWTGHTHFFFNEEQGSTAAWAGPAVAIDEAGNALAVWVARVNGQDKIFARLFDRSSGRWYYQGPRSESGVNWGEIQANSLDVQWDAQRKQFIALWSQKNNLTEHFVLRMAARPHGSSWQNAAPLGSQFAVDAGKPRFVVDPRGNLYVTWLESKDAPGLFSDALYWARRIANLNYDTQPAQLLSDQPVAKNPLAPHVAVRPATEQALVVWGGQYGTDFHSPYDLYVSSYHPMMGWQTRSEPLDESDGNIQAARVAIDSESGLAIAIWSQLTEGDSKIFIRVLQ